MPPAAFFGSAHTCPLSTPGSPPVPHTGGPISGPGAPKVLIGGQPASVLGDSCICVAPAMDKVAKGSSKVIIAGKPAVRLGDTTAHGGSITAGYPKVMIN